MIELRNLLLAVDFSDSCLKATEYAVALANRFEASLHLLHVIEDPVVYSKPWTLRTVLYRVKESGARIIEDECLEDANGVRHHISPKDPKNLLKSDYSRWKKPAQR
jgi:nucleotide-binding universal stress UspA family protein